jgi:hypothetical protein
VIDKDGKTWLTIEQWAERQNRTVTHVRRYVASGNIPSRLFTKTEIFGTGGRQLIPMISSETVGTVSRKKTGKGKRLTKKEQAMLQAARRRAKRERDKLEVERQKKIAQANRYLDPLPFLGWCMSRSETDLQLAQKAGYADDRAINKLWTGVEDAVRYEYVERILTAHNRTVNDVYKDIK